MRFACLTALVLALCACAETPPPAAAPAASAQAPAAGASGVQVAQQVCHRELPIGSSIPVTRCETAESKQDVQQMLNDIARTGGARSRTSGVN